MVYGRYGREKLAFNVLGCRIIPPGYWYRYLTNKKQSADSTTGTGPPSMSLPNGELGHHNDFPMLRRSRVSAVGSPSEFQPRKS